MEKTTKNLADTVQFTSDEEFLREHTDVIVLENGPTLLVAYFTLISPFSPGTIGCFENDGTVQPQELLIFEIIIGAFPLLTKVKTLLPSSFLFIVP